MTQRTRRRVPAAPLSHALSVLGVFALGVIGSGWLARWLADTPVSYLFLPAGYVAVVLVHELGHAAAGLLLEFRVVCLLMGPARVEWSKAGRVALRLNRRLSLWGGAVGLVPRVHPSGEALGAFRRRMIAVLAGGGGASVAVGAVALGVSFMNRHPAPQPFGDGASWLQFLALSSVVIGLGQAVPIRIGTQRSDGLRILRLLRARPGADQTLLEAIVVANMDGVRPREWPVPESQTFAAITDLPTLMLIYYGLVDRGRHAEAWDVLDLAANGQDGGNGGTWQAVRDLERTYLRAVYCKDDARGLFSADIPNCDPNVSALSLLRTRAALMVARGEVQEAIRCVDSVRHMRSASGTSGLAQFNLSEIDRILASAG